MLTCPSITTLGEMRIEKGYHGWPSDFGTEYTLQDAGLSKFTDMKKCDFLGRDAVLKQADQPTDWNWIGLELDRAGTGSGWNWIGLEVTEEGPEPLASDPILLGGA